MDVHKSPPIYQFLLGLSTKSSPAFPAFHHFFAGAQSRTTLLPLDRLPVLPHIVEGSSPSSPHYRLLLLLRLALWMEGRPCRTVSPLMCISIIKSNFHVYCLRSLPPYPCTMCYTKSMSAAHVCDLDGASSYTTHGSRRLSKLDLAHIHTLHLSRCTYVCPMHPLALLCIREEVHVPPGGGGRKVRGTPDS